MTKRKTNADGERRKTNAGGKMRMTKRGYSEMRMENYNSDDEI